MVAIASCFIVRDNKILLVREAKKEWFNKWSLPAGHVEVGW